MGRGAGPRAWRPVGRGEGAGYSPVHAKGRQAPTSVVASGALAVVQKECADGGAEAEAGTADEATAMGVIPGQECLDQGAKVGVAGGGWLRDQSSLTGGGAWEREVSLQTSPPHVTQGGSPGGASSPPRPLARRHIEGTTLLS